MNIKFINNALKILNSVYNDSEVEVKVLFIHGIRDVLLIKRNKKSHADLSFYFPELVQTFDGIAIGLISTFIIYNIYAICSSR